ncbi:MAG: bifunctional glutamate N-acetyltransferase/amino-acid acetyltransferase ArgJ [Chloroflexota bacterium]|nr:bifunctional glutamate N-acetyltransferase/amino-acid acetyltransferase ArgJ [Chloroflexota bacterium]
MTGTSLGSGAVIGSGSAGAATWRPIPGGITAPRGMKAGSVIAGLRSRPAPDVALLAMPDGASAAGAFTTNQFRAAPVQLSEAALAASGGQARAVVVNAGCANAGTGPEGLADAQRVAAAAARLAGCATGEVLTASTGLIGSRLDADAIERSLPHLRLSASRAAGRRAAEAILTTDTRTKEAALAAELGGRRISVGGMAKGSGMIHPQMATMLAFVATDAAVEPGLLAGILRDAVRDSFNQISVDGDGSTNDTVFLLATGAADGPSVAEEPAARGFVSDLAAGISAVCRSLAQQIAADGEGATRLIEVHVTGAATDDEARLVARGIAASNLVKAAVHGADPNWGRIAAAAGRSGATLDPARLGIWIGDQRVFAGEPCAFDRRTATRSLRLRRVGLRVDLGIGHGAGEAWGCDLSAEYVAINSEYET